MNSSFTGPADDPDALGVEGTLRRNERNRVNSFDQYLQASWAFAPDWNALVGLRHSKVGFVSSDRYLDNGDDSGRTTYEASTPVAGLMYKLSNDLHLYASFGRGFETPTFNELAYRPGGGGLNLHNYAYKIAPRDGSYLFILTQNAAVEQVSKTPGIAFDTRHFNFIGRLHHMVIRQYISGGTDNHARSEAGGVLWDFAELVTKKMLEQWVIH